MTVSTDWYVVILFQVRRKTFQSVDERALGQGSQDDSKIFLLSRVVLNKVNQLSAVWRLVCIMSEPNATASFQEIFHL